MKIKKGDKVIIIAGKDKGKTGVITAVSLKEQKVLVEKVNVRTVHIKPSQTDQQGGIKKIEKPIHLSNVMLVEPTAKKGNSSTVKASRVGLKREKDPKTNKYKTVRYLKKGNIEI